MFFQRFGGKQNKFPDFWFSDNIPDSSLTCFSVILQYYFSAIGCHPIEITEPKSFLRNPTNQLFLMPQRQPSRILSRKQLQRFVKSIKLFTVFLVTFLSSSSQLDQVNQALCSSSQPGYDWLWPSLEHSRILTPSDDPLHRQYVSRKSSSPTYRPLVGNLDAVKWLDSPRIHHRLYFAF